MLILLKILYFFKRKSNINTFNIFANFIDILLNKISGIVYFQLFIFFIRQQTLNKITLNLIGTMSNVYFSNNYFKISLLFENFFFS